MDKIAGNFRGVFFEDGSGGRISHTLYYESETISFNLVDLIDLKYLVDEMVRLSDKL